MTGSVYGLFEPETDTCRYVGFSEDPKDRLKGHLEDCEHERSAKSAWIRELKSRGQTPKLVILESNITENWEEREKVWIAFMKSIGEPLLNSSDGGLGVVNPPATTRALFSESGKKHKGRPMSDEQKKKLSVTMKLKYGSTA